MKKLSEISENSQKLASAIFTWGKENGLTKRQAYDAISEAFDDSEKGLMMFQLSIQVRPWLIPLYEDWEENYFQKEGFNEWGEERLREAMDEIGEIFRDNH